jgi:pimeloyl-ACP methyl ester carboxylesterase
MPRTPLVLLHGFTDTPRTWDPLVPLLQPHHELHALATLGHSGGAPLPERMDDPRIAMIEQVERDMDEAGLETAHLVGNSHGGWLALELAARGRARSVVALSPGGGWLSQKVADRVIRKFQVAHALGQMGARHADAIAARPRLRKLALRDVIAHGDRVRPSTAAALIRSAECAMYEPWADVVRAGHFPVELRAIDVPVRIAWGTEDRILPKEDYSPGFRTLVPGAEWVDLPGCGHLPHHDDPRMVARVILDVTLARTAAAAAA